MAPEGQLTMNTQLTFAANTLWRSSGRGRTERWRRKVSMNNLHPIFAAILRGHFPTLDLSRAAPVEQWECANCFHRGPLTQQGRCEKCGSTSVISQEVIR